MRRRDFDEADPPCAPRECAAARGGAAHSARRPVAGQAPDLETAVGAALEP